MHGGIVVEVAECRSKSGLIYVDCRERRFGLESAGVLLVRNEDSLRIDIGDALWWMGQTAYWTPCEISLALTVAHKKGVDFDIPIRKVGPGGVEYPDQRKEVRQ